MGIEDKQRELSRRERRRKKKRERILIKFAIILIGILILAVFLSYVISDEAHIAEDLVDKYNSLGEGRVSDSKQQFSKKLQFITVYTDENGQLKLSLGGDVQTDGTGNEDSDNDEEPSTGSDDDNDNISDIPDITESNYTKEQVEEDIKNGKYTKEDVDYITSLTKEAGGYNGNLAVAAVVLNRSKQTGASIKAVVTAPGQFAGYCSSDVGKWTADMDLFNASIALLRGDAKSPIGDAKYFFGRYTGYDMYADKGVGVISNIGNNIFYSNYGKMHNKAKAVTPSGCLCIFDHVKSEWKLKDGQQTTY